MKKTIPNFVELESNESNTKLTIKELLPACKPVFVVVSIALIIMLAGILLIELVPNNIGKVLMIVFGAIELILGIAYYLVADYQEKYICSECGAKREHHREYLGQTSKSRSQKTNLYRSNRDFIECLITEYRYEYLHTYVCAQCGNVYKENRWEDGGKIFQYVDQMVIDKRKDIREF